MKSKFIEALKKLSQSSIPPMGFGRRREDQSSHPLMLIASVASLSEEKEDFGSAGLDAILFSGAKINRDSLKRRLQSQQVPWGVQLKSAKDSAELKGLGVDFVVFPSQEMEASVLKVEGVGKIMEIEPDMSDSQLRTLEFVPLDAILLPLAFKGSTLTVQNLLACQRIDLLITKPLLGHVPAKISGEDLRLLWEAGLDGAIIKGEEFGKEELEKLKETVKSFPPHRGEKKKADALLPPTTLIQPEDESE